VDGLNKVQESTGKITGERLSARGLPSQQAQAVVEAVTLPPPPPRVQPETAASFDWQTWRLEVRTAWLNRGPGSQQYPFYKITTARSAH
jgi:hypothetical protein